MVLAPWTINSSDSLDAISKIENNSIGKYQSTTCTYSFFEFLIQNPKNNYLINLDKPATIDCFSKINGADEINNSVFKRCIFTEKGFLSRPLFCLIL